MADIANPNYETVTATCDHCRALCVFNRIDDIGAVMPIAGRRVGCFTCGQEFWIKGDTVNTAYQFLLDDAKEHFSLKRYMPAIASIAQAWEVFFATCVLSIYVYRPFFAARPQDQRVRDLNRLHRDVHRATAKFAFFPMRNVVMNMLIEDPWPSTLEEASNAIAQIAALGGEPAAETIVRVTDEHTRELLHGLNGLSVGKLRNDVVHKHAYRPKKSQVEPCFTSEISLLYRVKHHLAVGDFLEHQAGAVYDGREGERERPRWSAK